jgi:hypothetical protein
VSENDRDPEISGLYRNLPRETPPEALDREILAVARREARQRSLRRWRIPSLATAAVLVLGVAISLRILVEAPAPSAVPPTAEHEGHAAVAELAVPGVQKFALSGPEHERLKQRNGLASRPRIAAAAPEVDQHAGLPVDTLLDGSHVGPWDAATPLGADALTRAFPGAHILPQEPEGFVVLHNGEPALRLLGKAGEPARRIEAYRPAERWLPGLGEMLAGAARSRTELLCGPRGEPTLCREPKTTQIVYRFAGDRAEALVWTRHD